ncbi:energy-coupling factor transporter transmembrane component T family protein [Agrilactobacillus fermenti]|uniref:energy-coupling factor transporter transmembrane component T family protein n=1 Tax=Agrilactobacillus fermenti TaxID=2586909 RepID=UPI001E3A0D3A|nr:energy-coupling factor transporter transmembrane component T [Agrilactobacillus fermenti]MCD2255649.1 energy-coupling factor transporter transmembrane protein EcfT [Agrilactobacillus fermenti]
MNPSFKFIVAIILALEISFTNNYWVNLILILGSLLYIVRQKVPLRKIVWLFIVPLLPAVGLTVSMILKADQNFAFVFNLFTRLYAFIFIGSAATLTTEIYDLILSLQQNLHLPTKFAYGFLAAFNLFPKVKHEVQVIKTASMMRGITLRLWSPQLYFKAILSAFSWSENLAEAMVSHGFTEDQTRTYARTIPLTRRDWLLSGGILLSIQLLLVGTPYIINF